MGSRIAIHAFLERHKSTVGGKRIRTESNGQRADRLVRGAVLVQRGRITLDADLFQFGVELHDAKPTVAAVGVILIIGQHFVDGEAIHIGGGLPELLVEVPAIHHANGRIAAHQPAKNVFRLISTIRIDALEGVPNIRKAAAWHHRNARGVILSVLHVPVRGQDSHAIAMLVEDGLGPHHLPRGDITFQMQPKEVPATRTEDLGVAHPTW